jgi:CheY-like chemotaxis protein
MILAAVADLMFSSRIRAAASAAGAPVEFARTAGDVLERAREGYPSLVLFDLNAGASLDPIGTIARFKADDRLRAIPLVGFVSHVETEVIAAARAAGIDEVLARSAFVARLPELLSR